MGKTKNSRKALARVNYDMFTQMGVWSTTGDKTAPEQKDFEKSDRKEIKLPLEFELYMLFDQLNHKFFGGSLPRAKISYSGRMLIAGSFAPAKKEIKIGRKYHRIFPEEIEDTLKHEMIHILYPNHDARFKAVAAGIGASLKAQAHPDLRGKFKYLYVCPSCGKEYPRRKRIRMASCGTCSLSGFDPGFKLKLVKSNKKKTD